MLRLLIRRQTNQGVKKIKKNSFRSSKDKNQCYKPPCLFVQTLQQNHLNLLVDVCHIQHHLPVVFKPRQKPKADCGISQNEWIDQKGDCKLDEKQLW